MTTARVHVTVILEEVKLIPGFHTRSIVLGVNRVSSEIKYYLLYNCWGSLVGQPKSENTG